MIVLTAEKKRLIKSKNLASEIKTIGTELSKQTPNIIGVTLLDIAEILKKKYHAVYKGVIDINRTISKVHHPLLRESSIPKLALLPP